MTSMKWSLLSLVFMALAVRADSKPGGLEGYWLTEGGEACIEIGDCEGTPCGHVRWLRDRPDVAGAAMKDIHNPNEALRDRALLGVQVLSGSASRASGKTTWTGARIYDPDSGKTYRCTLKLRGDELRLRGYVLIPLFGRTSEWTRLSEEELEFLSREANPTPPASD